VRSLLPSRVRSDQVRNSRPQAILLTALASLALALAAGQAALAADLTLSDSTFNPGDWAIWVDAFPTSSTVSAAKGVVTGRGNPAGTDPLHYREVTDTVGAAPGHVLAAHIYTATGSTYDSTTDGPIKSIDFSIFYRCFNLPPANVVNSCTNSGGQSFSLAIKQTSGKGTFYYRAPGTATGTVTAWNAFYKTGYTASSFTDISGNPASPDFTSPGVKTQCGFYTGNSAPSGGGAYKNVVDYDDWTCVIHSQVVSGPTYDPCCPPWNLSVLKNTMFYSSNNPASGPYTLLFSPSPANNALWAYLNYMNTLNPANTSLTISFELDDGGTGSTYSYVKVVQTGASGTWTLPKVLSLTPTSGFFALNSMQVNHWYRVHTVISLNGDQLLAQCVTTDWILEFVVLGPRGKVMRTKLPNGRVIEQSINAAGRVQ
jgi:hypothetical protein